MAIGNVTPEYAEMLAATLRTDEGMQKIASNLSRSMRKMTYESSVCDRVMTPKLITPDDCDADPNHVGGLQVVVHREFTNARAIQSGYRGLADLNYVETDAFTVRAFKLETDTQSLKEGEIRGLRIPFKEQIQRQCTFQISKQRDAYFVAQLEMSLDDNPEQRITSRNSSVTFEDLIRLKNVLAGRGETDGLYLSPTTFIMTEVQYNNLSKMIMTQYADGPGPGMAGGITHDFWQDGYKYPRIAGCRIIVTRKTDLFPNNRIYCLPDEQFIGYNYTFNQARFMMRREFDLYEFKAIDDMMLAIGNTYAVSSLELEPETVY